MAELETERHFLDRPDARRVEWQRYYSEKRIGQQWFQVHLLSGLEVERVLEIGPSLGLVTALLDNAGYQVTTLDRLPCQYPRPHLSSIQADVTEVDGAELAGFDAIICCETLEHLHWPKVDGVLQTFRAAGPKYLIISVPFMGFQLDWRLYVNLSTWRSKLSLKLGKWLQSFKFDEARDPWGHKWEVGYRGTSLKALERKLHNNGWSILRRDFTSPTRSVFYLLEPK